MADAVWNPLVNIDPRYFLTGDVVERPPTERPKHDTIEAIIDWLAGPAQHIPLLVREFDEYAWRMLAAGFPLLRATLQLRTLHPQYLGATFVWWRTTGQTVQTFITHEVQDLFGDQDNPVRRVLVAGETVRRRVDVADDELDFPILHDLKVEGATDYFALPVINSFGTNYMVTYVTDRLGGFTDQEISDLTRVSPNSPNKINNLLIKAKSTPRATFAMATPVATSAKFRLLINSARIAVTRSPVHDASIDVRSTQEASRRPVGVSYLLPIQRMITTTTGD
jgi:hypothetical protein